ncbi:hypothetical protein CSUI_007403 [Cystoisospora suis]|uniref:Uncharacterized protein n=1 Tax=Cystoisospora suis TaxID=483139 RepID=A0A2C6KQR7_9APIC|nr:hypothetical protein CSUI_007403 [Cystoisospora suis]
MPVSAGVEMIRKRGRETQFFKWKKEKERERILRDVIECSIEGNECICICLSRDRSVYLSTSLCLYPQSLSFDGGFVS